MAFQKSRGKYWCPLGSDDVFLPKKLEYQVAFLESNPELAFVHSYASIIGQDGGQSDARSGPRLGTDISLAPDKLGLMIQVNSISAPTMMIRRECMERVGLHDEALVYSDWEYWIRLLAHYKGGFLRSTLSGYRIHGANVSVGPNWTVQWSRTVEVMVSLRDKSLPLTGAFDNSWLRSLINLKLAYLYALVSDKVEMSRSIAMAFQANPIVRDEVAFLARRLGFRMQMTGLSHWLIAHPWVFERFPQIIGTAQTEHHGQRSVGPVMAQRSINWAVYHYNHQRYGEAARFLMLTLLLNRAMLADRKAIRLAAKLAIYDHGRWAMRKTKRFMGTA